MYFVPLLALGAGINFTCMHFFLGKYPDVNEAALIIFDVTNIIYCMLGLYFAKRCEDKDGNLKPKFVYAGKLVMSFVIIIQWNYISYMIPSRDYWAFFTLFIFATVFFLDSKYVLHTIGIVDISMIVSWIISPDTLLPVRDEYFVPEMVLRCILVFFISVIMYLITFIVEKLLVKELENIAEYDSLTLLRNRRTLGYMLDNAIDSFNKNGQTFCFLMGDIDDFKIVNDTYGHPFGDIVLKNLGRSFILNFGDECHIFRYGGEEICMIIYTDLDHAMPLAENMRLKIEKQVHELDNIKVNVTMSMGIVEYRKGMSKEDLIKVSDANLYYAKSHGKNKIIS